MIRTRVLLSSLMLLTTAGFCYSQQPKIGGDFIPPDAMLTITANPSALMNSKTTVLYPWEVAEAWCLDTLGFSLENCESMKFVSATPGPSGVSAALVIQMKTPFRINDLTELVIGDGETLDVDGLDCLVIPDSPDVVIHQFNTRTFIISSQDYLDNVIEVAEGNENGPLALLANETDRAPHLSFLMAVEPVRAMVSGFAQMMVNQMPPQLREFASVPQKLDAISFHLNMDGKERGVILNLTATDEAAANDLHQLVTDGLEMTRDMALQQALSQLQDAENDPIQAASTKYANRMSEMILDGVMPEQNGKNITFSTGVPMADNVMLQAMFAGMLLPAVQQARLAAVRVDGQNNLKEMALAMHNYHSAFNKLPSSIKDGNNKPLLSWRVAILPFIEEQALYEQFHLDEPWDSDHNKTLIAQMPAVFKNKRVDLAKGKTVYQVPVGPSCMFTGKDEIRFRDVIDGLSNTIMIYESSADSAVEWTKPSDVEIDLDNPLKTMGNIGGAFSVALGDGYVQQVTRDVDADVLKGLLTRNGKESVGDF